MSMIRCDECEHLIDSDDDPDCFVELGNHSTKIYCEWCRESLFDDDEPDVDDHVRALRNEGVG